MKQETADGSGRMFDGIAERYDLLNRINSLGLDKGWRKVAIESLELCPGHRVLDLATGTADVAIQIADFEPAVDVVGVDPSSNMLTVGRKKVEARSLDSKIVLEEGDAQALRFRDESFDRVTMAFGIRNVPDRNKALQEIYRVLKPGGRAAILELSEPSNGFMAFLARLHMQWFVPATGALFSGKQEYKYLRTSIEAFPKAEDFEAMLEGAGLVPRTRKSFSFGACTLYIADRPRPEELAHG